MITFSEIGNFGRLGNQMFQIASTIGIAWRNNELFMFNNTDTPFDSLTDYMDIIQVKKRIDIPWGYHELKLKNVDIHGYLQSERYFAHCKEFIKELFVFDYYPEKPYKEFISVHLRRGDYDGNHLALLDRTYYEKALSQLPDIPIVVFTDEPEKVQGVIPRYDKIICQETYHDIAMMTLADYHIIANSSYSWWGAWLSKSKKIIAPSKWFGPALSISPQDIYTDDMIII